MALQPVEQVASFIVRFQRGVALDRSQWQGLVEHVQSGNQKPFHSAEELLTVFEKLSQLPRQAKEDKSLNKN